MLRLIEQISRCRLVIVGSYHAAVFALAQGVSAIGLAGNAYYLQKFEGLAANQFGLRAVKSSDSVTKVLRKN